MVSRFIILVLLALSCLSASAATHKSKQAFLEMTKDADTVHLWTLRGTIKNSINPKGPSAALTNVAFVEDPKAGTVVQLTGDSNSYVDFGNVLGDIGTKPFTLALWIKATNPTYNFYNIIGNRVALQGSYVQFALYGKFLSQVNQDGSDTNHAEVSTNPQSQSPLDGEWHYYTCTRDGTTLTLYIDGEFVAKKDSAAPTNIQTSAPLRLGVGLPGYPALAGRYARVAVYDGALSAKDAAAKYRASKKELFDN